MTAYDFDAMPEPRSVAYHLGQARLQSMAPVTLADLRAALLDVIAAIEVLEARK